ncbi:MAG: peptidylprolyl isomerase [Candidatus Altimarinota bacterium]
MKKTIATLVLCFTIILSGCTGNSAQTNQNSNGSQNNSSQDRYSSYGGEITAQPINDNQNTMDNSTQLAAPKSGDTIATLETSLGTIKAKLFASEAPETVKNFTELAKEGKYDGVTFHRVIEDFMIQTGDFEKGNGTGGHSYKGPGTKFNDEFAPGLANLQGTLSMANSGANTNGSQFFIVTSADGTPWLNGKHSVFGQIYEGLDVALKISQVETDLGDKPVETVTINKVTISTL